MLHFDSNKIKQRESQRKTEGFKQKRGGEGGNEVGVHTSQYYVGMNEPAFPSLKT